ncbi:hypothetical protein FCULG_00012203 [Fusarium culmorum]|uniref:Uncharacterized protein n=1 Tax=Fusarium culmorum TaxID=5516 RepID=A0A2T4GEU3_FUSCU|nr:hypothetical protein FCULG_00012203 [Fusarium culmorum]
MAGVIQFGDAIKFAEIAWTVWQYGWAKANNAEGKNYHDFGEDVLTLHSSLKHLENAVTRAQQSLHSHGVWDNDSLCGDQDSLMEVVGDYNDTLEECYLLLKDNTRYAQTTGPIKNIEWNMSIMPEVERLRGRIQMHTSRIQHILKPFEIDLFRNIHQELNRRFMSIHRDLRGIRETVDSLLKHQNPSLASEIEQRRQKDICSVEISDSLLDRLEHILDRRQSTRLSMMADCFLIHLRRATLQPQHNLSVPVPNYLPFAKCQLLMNRMKRLHELRNPQWSSYWPGYIGGLEEKLSEEYSRVQSQIVVPDTSTCNDEMLAFWPEDEPQAAEVPTAPAVEYTCLFQGPLATLSPYICWREVKLLRHPKSMDRFKVIETFEWNKQQRSTDSRVLDFDLRSAVLIPLYADPTAPLEIIIKANGLPHHYVFLCLQDILAFQAFITGFKVMDGYMDQVYDTWDFGTPEDVTIQVWIPREWTDTDESATNEPPDDPMGRGSGHSSSTPSLVQRSSGWSGSKYKLQRSQSIPTTGFEPSTLTNGSSSTATSSRRTSSTTHEQCRQPDRQSRPGSISSHRSTTTSSSGMSYSSLSSQQSVTVNGSSTGTGYGTIRTRPRSPLLVLFTGPKGPESRRSIVAITLDKGTVPDWNSCKCARWPTECRITALQNERGRLEAWRFDGDTWDLLRLAVARHGEQRRWDGLIRVSIGFAYPDLRSKFGGAPCKCYKVTEGEVETCHLQGHQGLLGVMRDFHRRLLTQYRNQTDSQVDVINCTSYG